MLSQLGLIYVYVLLATLTIGLGYAGLRGIERISDWSMETLGLSPAVRATGSLKNTKPPQSLKRQETLWIRMALVSATVLFLSIFAMGALKTVGAGENSHQHQATQSNPPVNWQQGTAVLPDNPGNADLLMLIEMQNRLNQMQYELNQMQAFMQNPY